MSAVPSEAGDQSAEDSWTGEGSWLWNHIGRISGIILGMIAFGSLAFIAVIGYKPAFFLLVLIFAGFAMIAVGGRLRGGR